MCSLKPKDQFHLYGVSLSSLEDRGTAGLSDHAMMPSTQKEEVHQLLRSFAADGGPADSDPHRRFLSSIAQAALQACLFPLHGNSNCVPITPSILNYLD